MHSGVEVEGGDLRGAGNRYRTFVENGRFRLPRFMTPFTGCFGSHGEGTGVGVDRLDLGGPKDPELGVSRVYGGSREPLHRINK